MTTIGYARVSTRDQDLSAQLAVLQAAYTAEVAFGELEDAYHRPLAGKEGEWP